MTDVLAVTMSELTITTLAQHDPAMASAIHRVHLAAYTVERDLIVYPDFPPLRVTQRQIQEEPGTFLGAWDAGSLVGVLSFEAEPDRLAIGRLVVDPRWFRRGVGSALLHAVERWPLKRPRLTVSTAERNWPAVALYRKHGYELIEQTTLPDGLVLVRFAKEAP